MARDRRKVADLGGSCENDVVVVCTRGATRGLGAFTSGPFSFKAVVSIVTTGAAPGQLPRCLGLLRIRRLRTPGYRQRTYGRTIEGKKTFRKRAESDWHACIPDAHPGYITWQRYHEILRMLASNGHGYDAARISPPREGVALLQGLVVCGRCGQHMRARYRDHRGKAESWYVCDRVTDARPQPNCQSIAGTSIDEAVGRLVADRMTPAAVDLALEIRREIEARHDEADQLRCRAVERAQIDANLAQRRFMMVDPGNRLVADTLESDWNEKLRVLANVRDERERARRQDQVVIDDAIRERLVAMTADFGRLWSDPSTPNRERKRMLAYVIEDVTLVKVPGERITKVHLRFRGGQATTLTTVNPKASWEKVKTPPEIVELVDTLLEDHLYAEIANILNARGLRPGGSCWPGRGEQRFSALRVQYIVHTYGLRMRFDRLRARGMLTKDELAARLGIHPHTLIRWAKHGIIQAHAYTRSRFLYEEPGPNAPKKQCSRWNRVADRAAKLPIRATTQDAQIKSKEA